MSSQRRAAGPPGPSGGATASPPRVWQLLSALSSTGGLLGTLFILNAIGGLVLAIAIVVLRGQLLLVASVLGLLFIAGTLLSLVLALTVGLFGIRSSLDYELAPTTLVVESIGTIVLAVTTVLVFRTLHTRP
jgi:hypothetical protein